VGISFYSPEGTLLPAGDVAGPWQLNSEGLNTGLERNSRPFENFIFNTRTYQLLYQHQLWVKVAVDKLTYQISRLPLKVYEGESADKKRLTSGPLYDSIHSPAPGKRTGALLQWGLKPALIQGASALRIVRGARGVPTGYLPLYWQWLDPRTADGVPDGIVDFYRYTPPGASQPEILLPNEVVLIAWETADGRVGDSPLRPLLDTLSIEYLAKHHMQQMLKNGVRPPGGISWGDGSPELIQLAQDAGFRQRFTEELERLYGGAAGKPLNLPPGAKWQAFGYTNTEAEMVAHRKLTPIEVARPTTSRRRTSGGSRGWPAPASRSSPRRCSRSPCRRGCRCSRTRSAAR
jgi:HK97 family phage portal protein